MARPRLLQVRMTLSGQYLTHTQMPSVEVALRKNSSWVTYSALYLLDLSASEIICPRKIELPDDFSPTMKDTEGKPRAPIVVLSENV